MRPGLSVRVEVVRGSWPKALSVPRGAVRFEKDGPVVRRQGGGTTAVKLAACTPLECVVVSGLAEGDRVALSELGATLRRLPRRAWLALAVAGAPRLLLPGAALGRRARRRPARRGQARRPGR